MIRELGWHGFSFEVDTQGSWNTPILIYSGYSSNWQHPIWGNTLSVSHLVGSKYPLANLQLILAFRRGRQVTVGGSQSLPRRSQSWIKLLFHHCFLMLPSYVYQITTIQVRASPGMCSKPRKSLYKASPPSTLPSVLNFYRLHLFHKTSRKSPKTTLISRRKYAYALCPAARPLHGYSISCVRSELQVPISVHRALLQQHRHGCRSSLRL